MRFSGNKIHCSPRDQSLSVYCYVMLRQVLEWLAIRTQHFQHFHRNIWMFMCPWHAISGPRAHALVQQCRENVAKRLQHQQHPKCCSKNLTVFKFDPAASNMLQYIATRWANVCNMLCPTMLQNVVLKCCKRTLGHVHTTLLSVTRACSLAPLVACQRIGAHKHPGVALKMLKML